MLSEHGDLVVDAGGYHAVSTQSEVVRHVRSVQASVLPAGGIGDERGKQMRSCMHTNFPWGSKQIVYSYLVRLMWPLPIVSFKR